MLKNFSVKGFYNFILKFFLVCPVFLLPFFVLPFTATIWEINKIYLLGFCVTISLFLYLLKISFSHEFEFKKSFFLSLAFLFLFFSFLSTLFSLERYFSFIGSFGLNNNGFLALFFLVIFFFLVLQVFEKPKILSNFFVAGGLVCLIVFLFMSLAPVSLLQKIPSAFNFLKIRFFNPASPSLSSLGFFLEALALFFIVHFFTTDKKLSKFFTLLFLFLLFLALFIIQNKIVWLNLLVGLILFIIFSTFFKLFPEKLNYFFLPIILVFLSLFFFLFGHNFSLFRLVEINLGQKFSWEITWQAIRSSFKNLLIGTGPATFAFNFLKFKTIEMNQAGFATITLEKPQNYFFNILVEQGLVSFVLFLALVVFFFVSFLKRGRPLEGLKYFFAWLSVTLSLFLAPPSYIIMFSFWLFLGLTILSSEKLYSLKKVLVNQPEQKIVLFFLTGLMVFLGFFLILFGRQYYLGEVFYKNYLIAGERKEKITNLEKAVNYDSRNSFYHLTLGQEYVNLFFEENKKKDQSEAKLAEILNRAVLEAERSTSLSANYSFFWQGRGLVYRNLQFFVNGALQKAEESFQKALSLDPKNPFIFSELAKIYFDTKDISKTKEYLEKGKALGVNYWELSLLEARVLEEEKNTDQAIALVESLERNFPSNPDIIFELGRMYFNAGKTDQAITKWEQLINIVPRHINGLYSLALAYEKKGDIPKAISFLEKVLEINPNLKEVEDYLNQLKAR